MHVMIEPATTGTSPRVAAVAFELNGSVLEPHELLQYDDRWFEGSNLGVFDHCVAVRRFCSRWLGVRGLVWAHSGETLTRLSFDMGSYGVSPPWQARQQMELRSGVWIASKVARDSFRLPSFRSTGMTDKALHIATKNAVLLQAAYRALLAAQVT